MELVDVGREDVAPPLSPPAVDGCIHVHRHRANQRASVGCSDNRLSTSTGVVGSILA